MMRNKHMIALRVLLLAGLLAAALAAPRTDVKFKPLDPDVTSPEEFWMPMWNPVPQDYCTYPRFPIVPTFGPIAMDVLYELYPNGTVPKAPPKPTDTWLKNLWGFQWNNLGDWGAVYPYPYVVEPKNGMINMMYTGAPDGETNNRQMLVGFAKPVNISTKYPIFNASYPFMTMGAAFDFGLQIKNGRKAKLMALNNFGATIAFQDTKQANRTVATLYIVKGSPFINVECNGAELVFGNDMSPPIIGLNDVTPGTTASGDAFMFKTAQGPVHMQAEMWHAYFSSSVSITLPDPPNKPLAVTGPFTGLLQMAAGELGDEMKSFLDKARGTFAKSVEVQYDIDDEKKLAVTHFKFVKGGDQSKPLTMLAIAHHLHLLPQKADTEPTKYWCVKGNMTAVHADSWALTYNLTTLGFGDNLKVDPIMAPKLLEAATLDYKLRINECPGDNTTWGYPGYMNMELYAYSRDLTQMVDIAIVLENLGKREMAINMTKKVLECMKYILKRPAKLPEKCPIPKNNTAVCVRDMMDVYYDTQWGGLVTGFYDRYAKGYCECDKGSAYACIGLNYCDNPEGWDGFANYGNAFYNDHHFQYGYIIKNLAWIIYFQETKKADLGVSAASIKNLTKQALAFSRDIANPDEKSDPYFTFVRHKDMYDGHSWAEGYDYSGRILTWVNQQSGGEAINGFYGVYLLGYALNDTNVRDWARIHLASEAFSVHQYQHLSNKTEDKKDQPTKIINDWGKCLSILIGNGASGATYYGPNQIFQCGITLLPITPYTREWVSADWAMEALDWMLWHNNKSGQCVFFNPETMSTNPCAGQLGPNWKGNEWMCCPTDQGEDFFDNQWRAFPDWYPYMYVLESFANPQKAWLALQYTNYSKPTPTLPFPYLNEFGDIVGYQHDLTLTAALFHVATYRRQH